MRSGQRKIVLFSSAPVEGEGGESFMPLGVIAIGSVLAREGYPVVVIDSQVDADWRATLENSLEDALMLGISCLTGPAILGALEAIRIARSVRPELTIVWGGYHATLFYRRVFDETGVDYVVRGSGERAIVALAEALSERPRPEDLADTLAGIPNLVFKRDGELVVNRQEQVIMEDLPPLDYDLIDVEKYFSTGNRRLYYISSYGCPFRCSFCVEPAQSGRKWRALSAKRVVDDLAALSARYRFDRVNYVDPNLSSDPTRVVAIAREMKRRNLYVEGFCDMRAADVIKIARLTDLSRLREVGFSRVFLGLESGSDRVLGLLKKDSVAEDALRACELLDAAGIQQDSSFVHDIPCETAEDSEETLRLAERLCRLPLNRQLHHWFMPYPVTETFDEIVSTEDALTDRSLLDWARSSTYWGSEIWPGRPGFRRRVLRRLFALKREYPETFKPPSTLPVLRRIELDGARPLSN